MKTLSKRKVALYKHLLHNGTLSIKTAYTDFGISNIAREVRRLIEIPLNIELKRVKKVGTTKGVGEKLSKKNNVYGLAKWGNYIHKSRLELQMFNKTSKFIGIEKEANYYEIACQRCGF